MNSIIFLLARGKIVGQTGLLNFGLVTGLGEGKPCSYGGVSKYIRSRNTSNPGRTNYDSLLHIFNKKRLKCEDIINTVGNNFHV